MSLPERPAGVDPSPFDLPGRGRAAALCLHGLTGTPYEVRSLGEALARRGVRALGPALPGHNETPERLAKLPYTAWLEAAREHHRALQERHERVFLVGMSLGGLLSLALAAEEGADALVTVGVSLRFSRPVRWLVPLVKHLHPFLRKRVGSDIRDPEARARHPSYDRMPLASVHEFAKLQDHVMALLPRVKAPLLAAHGAHDRTARLSDCHTLTAGVGSGDVQLLVLESSGHIVPVDRDGPDLARAAGEFLDRYA